MSSAFPALVIAVRFALAAGDAPPPGVLPETSTMLEVAARPRDPFRDPLPKDPGLAKQIQLGYQIFTDTPRQAAKYSGSALSCGNCHLNAGQRDGAMPVVGVAGIFPEYNNRCGRLFSLQDRIVSCFLRSLNGGNAPGATERNSHENAQAEPFVSQRSPEVLAVAAYITWLSEGQPVGQKPPSRGVKQLAPEARIPIAQLSPAKGRELYADYCQGCHGEDGQGVDLEVARPGPLWGPRSWSDGASLARTYMLAGMIRHAMPYLGPGSLTDEEAQQIAAYITSQPRPHFRAQARDYAHAGGVVPEDAVYDTRRFPKNPLAQ